MEQLFTTIANRVAHVAGKPVAFIACVAIILAWAISGPVFGFSDTWQLIINTGTTIVTFLMVFLIQNTQNRDGAALQAKLDELIRVTEAQNRFVGIEHLTESEVEKFRELTEKAARAADRARGAEGSAGQAKSDAADLAEEAASNAVSAVRKASRSKARSRAASN